MFVLVERALEGMAQNYVPASGSGAIKAGGGFEFVERVLEGMAQNYVPYKYARAIAILGFGILALWHWYEHRTETLAQFVGFLCIGFGIVAIIVLSAHN